MHKKVSVIISCVGIIQKQADESSEADCAMDQWAIGTICGEQLTGAIGLRFNTLENCVIWHLQDSRKPWKKKRVSLPSDLECVPLKTSSIKWVDTKKEREKEREKAHLSPSPPTNKILYVITVSTAILYLSVVFYAVED
ncbi:hypothetical protein STEG23_032984 [Scotinomys teguina]